MVKLHVKDQGSLTKNICFFDVIYGGHADALLKNALPVVCYELSGR